MREILFRGLRKDGRGFAYGYLIIRTTRNLLNDMLPLTAQRKCFIHHISEEGLFDDILEEVEVIPESVGQYTGLNDKNGVKIFEGDKVKSVFEYKDTFIEIYGIVKQDTINPSFCIEYKFNGDGHICYEYDFVQSGLRINEVIGNIHESRIATNKN